MTSKQNQQGLLRPHQSKLSIFYRFTDSAIIALSLLIATTGYGISINVEYQLVMFMTMGLFSIIAETQSLYLSFRGATFFQLASPVIKSWVITVCILLGLGYMVKTTGNYSRITLSAWVILTPIMLISWRILIHSMLSSLRSKGYNTRKVAIIGAEDMGLNLAQTIRNTPSLGLKVVGFYDDRGHDTSRVASDIVCVQDETQLKQHEFIFKGKIKDVFEIARTGEVDLIYIALSLKAQDKNLEIIRKLADTSVNVHLVPDLFVFDLLHSRFVNLGSIPTISVYESPYFGVNDLIKRIEDIVLSCVILMLISVLMIFIAAAVKISSPGPVIFKQRRYGIDGREIKVWKFRSMTTTDDGNKIVQAKKGDERITKLGVFLRNTSLDELPQFINVLMGTMSVVGPRPHAVTHNEEYRGIISGYMLRHKVKPGITGWAQINGWRGETKTLEKMEKRIECDIQYIRQWSVWLDLQIVFQTVYKGFISKEAY